MEPLITQILHCAIQELNAAIDGYIHTDETRQNILSAVGPPDGEPRDAVNLNNFGRLARVPRLGAQVASLR